MSHSSIGAKAKAYFYFQYIIGRLMIFITAPLIFIAIKTVRYRIHEIDAVRRRVRDMMNAHSGPWLICANHLTLIDSVVLAYAMIPTWRYIFQYKLLPWNVPERMNFNRNVFVGLACFLTKCIPVIRGGDRNAVRSTLDKCAFLLEKGENLMIFPEGTRSRNGRVNTGEFPYGTGRLFVSNPDCRVMCFYMRGDGQHTYSSFPRFGETFTVMVKECRPDTELRGLRAHRDCSTQIVNFIAEMEHRYLASHRQ